MTRLIKNAPDARALMTSARSFGNYDLAAALADLIDNSIQAGADSVWIECLFEDGDPQILIRDNGSGMSTNELHAAMRPASKNPVAERSPDDLGRFGWGLKSASFSQAQILRVITKKHGKSSAAAWDLANIDDWKMEVFSAGEASPMADGAGIEGDGTAVLWENCDRLSEEKDLTRKAFNQLVADAESKLALTFHRFLGGEVPDRRLEIHLNGQAIKPADPFFRSHPATTSMEAEKVKLGKGGWVKMEPYLLPHFSKLNDKQADDLARQEGMLRNQGFYIYRNFRLIVAGTWFGLLQYGELSKLVRIQVDVPNSLDSIWKLTVDKSEVQLPSTLRKRFTQLISRFKSQSAKSYQARGQTLPGRKSTTPVWNRSAGRGEIKYRINKAHPLIQALFEKLPDHEKNTATAALRAIETGFPVPKFSQDAQDRQEAIDLAISTDSEFENFLQMSLPTLLAQHGGSVKKLLQELGKTEPYAAHFAFVEAFVKKEFSRGT